MRVSRKAEYACIAMLELAANYEQPQPVRVRAIAATHKIPQRFLVQILLHLKNAGLVASVRGAAGGYQLARDPEQISLADIIQAIDKEAFKLMRPASNSPAGQAIYNAWKEIYAAEQRLLDQLTLAELVRRIQQTSVLSYQI
jgi:Rrf2 family cysteine metabolism transcriptional repressor